MADDLAKMRSMRQKYAFYPFMIPLPGKSGDPQGNLFWCPARSGKKYEFGWALEYDDMNAVFDIAQLGSAGILERVRKCRCGKYHFQRFAHQRFCSEKCRIAEFRTSDEARQKRNDYPRKLYQLHKTKNVK